MSSEFPDYAQAQPQWHSQTGPQQQPDPQQQAWPQQQYGVQPYPQQWAQPQYQGIPAAVARKDPVLYLFLSFLLPGLGTMLLDNVGKGVGILALYVVGILLSLVLIGIPLAIGAWIWGMVDAYQSAQRWNQAHGIMS